VVFAPLPDALDMGRATKIIPVMRFMEPTALAGGLAGLAARGLGAVALARGATRVGSKEGLTVLALAFGDWTSHWPASPQTNDRQIAGWREEDEQENTRAGAERRRQKKWINITCGEEDGTV
jgi:hypothetical protein